ncbi:hypothetical protein CONPUDRAFT_159729 [Coniophora puteana RWD-64-598 SS2]|uniref:Uncharacterized protein n=1 Tax=Coniophora puteana (strain RWD-64-598) TaxID=741705 RepID=A0A5M3M6J9_CONPW|nr:uncharacterized protein CONPUDRAFT_159729 [Coniophora puteana RWD-64-598 SS2]EIW74969.1 hypothetical protein CONPUDRAFT_159729 [Coniophora puteana RWD-64-598 SS2]
MPLHRIKLQGDNIMLNFADDSNIRLGAAMGDFAYRFIVPPSDEPREMSIVVRQKAHVRDYLAEELLTSSEHVGELSKSILTIQDPIHVMAEPVSAHVAYEANPDDLISIKPRFRFRPRRSQADDDGYRPPILCPLDILDPRDPIRLTPPRLESWEELYARIVREHDESGPGPIDDLLPPLLERNERAHAARVKVEDINTQIDGMKIESGDYDDMPPLIDDSGALVTGMKIDMVNNNNMPPLMDAPPTPAGDVHINANVYRTLAYNGLQNTSLMDVNRKRAHEAENNAGENDAGTSASARKRRRSSHAPVSTRVLRSSIRANTALTTRFTVR